MTSRSESAAPGWIAVTDELPPMDHSVWLYEEGRICIGGRACSYEAEGWLWFQDYDTPIYVRGHGWRSYRADFEDLHPTHWMYLPGVPEIGDGQHR